jgi:hypothetical protein
MRNRPQGIAIINSFGRPYRLLKKDDKVVGSGFLGSSSVVTRFALPRLCAAGLAAAGLAAAGGSSAFMVRR